MDNGEEAMALQAINELVSLLDQVAIVTGGAKGIGEGIRPSAR
jgi:hypothetical protein